MKTQRVIDSGIFSINVMSGSHSVSLECRTVFFPPLYLKLGTAQTTHQLSGVKRHSSSDTFIRRDPHSVCEPEVSQEHPLCYCLTASGINNSSYTLQCSGTRIKVNKAPIVLAGAKKELASPRVCLNPCLFQTRLFFTSSVSLRDALHMWSGDTFSYSFM